MFRLLDSDNLVPPVWKNGETSQFHVFNPTIARGPDGTCLCCYRVVDVERRIRRIAGCKLSQDFSIINDSVVAISDLIRFGQPETLNDRSLTWHADPRLFVLRGRLYMTWNDGENRPQNHQFMVELDPHTLQPRGGAREIVADMPRRKIEKNWMFFELAGEVYCIYSMQPHVVLRVDLDDEALVRCMPHSEHHWGSEYSKQFGVLRGGAQPLPAGDKLLMIAHSSYVADGGRKYVMCCYAFDPKPPFRVTGCSRTPYKLHNPRGGHFSLAKLNPHKILEIVYPVGAVMQEAGRVAVSYGINDEVCALATLEMADLLAELRPVKKLPPVKAKTDAPGSTAAVNAVRPSLLSRLADFSRRFFPQSRVINADQPRLESQTSGYPPPSIPVYWWDSAGKLLDRGGERRFEHGNFGDLASRDIVARLAGQTVRQARPGERRLLSTGSVIHLARTGDIVWGSGSKGDKQAFDNVKHLDVYAVRGPLTADLLKSSGIDTSKLSVLFDPGCLIGELYKEELARHDVAANAHYGKIRIVPHFRDDLILRRENPHLIDHIVSVDCQPLDMARNLLGAEAVYSSSLHGIIFAEALGIPAYWLRSKSGEDQFKFHDYYYGTGRYDVKVFDDLADALKASPMPLPQFRVREYLDTFPAKALAGLARSGIMAGDNVRLAKMSADTLAHLVTVEPQARPGKEGLWITAAEASLRTVVHADRACRARLALRARPFNPVQLKTGQTTTVAVNNAPKRTIKWAPGAINPVTVNATIPLKEGANLVELAIISKHAVTPRSLGLDGPSDRLAVCLLEFGTTVSE